jgi:acylphosphatase
MENRAVTCFVSGMVQGVGFRYFTYREASRLSLGGYVRNLPDGRVQVYAEGPEDKLKDLIDVLQNGPRFSDVHHLDVQWESYQGKYKSFNIDTGS